MENCPLCNSHSQFNFQEEVKIYGILRHIQYFVCTQCQLLFKNKASFINENEEKNHYLQHKNFFNIEYLNPVLNLINQNINENWKVLDYGQGAKSIFEGKLPINFKLFTYDPLFQPNLIEQKYNLIICLEVVEHFKNCKDNWKHLVSLLDTNSYLIIRTELYDNKLENLKNWYYKNDPTHVNFLHSKTLGHISEMYKLEVIKINEHYHLLKTM